MKIALVNLIPPLDVANYSGYNQGLGILSALQKYGDDKVKIRDAIENTKNFIGINGYFNFSPQEHNGLDLESFVMIKVENMKFKLIEK